MEGIKRISPRMNFGTVLATVLGRVRQFASERRERSLRLVESLALGDRRFLAIVAVEGRRFLVGGAAGSIALLTQLPSGEKPCEVLEEHWRFLEE